MKSIANFKDKKVTLSNNVQAGERVKTTQAWDGGTDRYDTVSKDIKTNVDLNPFNNDNA